MPSVHNFSMIRGDDKSYLVTIRGPSGVVVDLSHAEVTFKAALPTTMEAVITKTLEVTDGPSGEAMLTLDAADTADLDAPVDLSFDIQVESGGKAHTPVSGTLRVEADVES